MKAFIATGLLLCLVGTCISLAIDPQQEECLHYSLESGKYIRVSDTKNLMKIKFDVLLRSYKGSNKVFTMEFREPEIFIDRKGISKIIDLKKCPSSIIPNTRILLPTLVVLDEEGLLKEIRVDKNEPLVATNIKLHVASLLQLNVNALKETEEPVETGKKELLNVGECPVTYQVKSDKDKTGENLRIIKRYKLNECTQKLNKNIEMKGISELQIRKEAGRIIPQYVFFNTSLNHKSDEGLHLDASVKLKLNKVDKCDAISPFVNYNAKVVTKQLLSPINNKLIKGSSIAEIADLMTIYKELASEGLATNIYQDLYERAIRCWDMFP